MSSGYYKGNIWYRIFKALVFRPIVKYIWRPEVIGAENIPTGGAILAANHIDAGDTLVLPSSVEPAMSFPAKKELFENKSLKGRLVAWFLKLTEQVPIDRSGGKEGFSTLNAISDKLENGTVIGIFPEGSRSVDGRLYKGHTGVARIALETNKPVLPVGLINTRFQGKKFGIPTMKDAKIIIGEPVDYSQYHDHLHNVKVLRWVTNDVMARIQKITGQEYVDVYLARVKRGDMKPEELDKYVTPHPNYEKEPPVV